MSFRLFPESASTFAPAVDLLTGGLLVLSACIIVLIFGLMVFFSIRERDASRHPRPIVPLPVRAGIEITWTLIPLLIALTLFGFGGYFYFKMHRPPDGALEIYVTGKQWMWKFQHPTGLRENDELHVPLGVPVKLIMTSEDVIHSLFIPAFRIKQDVVPGRYYTIWFQATRAGQYHLFCTQYCGLSHAKMQSTVTVMPQAEYARWLSGGSGTPMQGNSLASAGERHFTRLGCISCHGGAAGVKAPDLHGLYGKKVGLSDGSSVIADESYIRESILDPRAKIVQGYEPIMPSFKGQVSEQELAELIAYIKSLGAKP